MDTRIITPSYYYDTDKIPTTADILLMVNKKLMQNSVLQVLDDYYYGIQAIELKTNSDTTHPCNKVTANFCAEVADFYNSYLLGKPIQYKSNNAAYLKAITDIMTYNDSHDVDVQNNLASNVMGSSAEQIWVDKEGEIRFANIDFRSVIFVYNKDVDKELNSVIKFYKYLDTDPYYTLELWTPTTVTKYRLDLGVSSLETLEPEKGHNMGFVPFVEYENNEYRQSSFGKIMSMQDAYNTLLSAEIDDYEGFVDSFLAIYNAAGTDSDDIAKMKTERVLLLDGESKAEWLTKNANPQQIEEIKDSLKKSIHSVASYPDLSDISATSDASGVAVKYKLIGAESVAARQERKFKRAIQKRIEIITKWYNFVNSTDYKYTDITLTFNRNMIGADYEVCEMINFLYGKVPIKTLAAKLSWMDDSTLNEIPTGVQNSSSTDVVGNNQKGASQPTENPNGDSTVSK